MKIGLIPQVLIHSQYPQFSIPYVPLGLLCVAGALDRNRHSIEIIDLTTRVKEGDLAYDNTFDDEVARLIISRGFDLVGFSTLSALYHHTLNIASRIKELSPQTIVTFGGPQASFADVDTIKHFPVDYIVRGEAEITFPLLLNTLEGEGSVAGVDGLTYREGGEVKRSGDQVFIADLDRLPFPAYDLYPLENHPKAPVEGTRGCPYHCTYCATSLYWGRQVRHKSPQRVYEEMKFLKERYAVKRISFSDDTFTVHRAKTAEVCSYLIERGVPCKWYCSTRIDAVDGSLLKLMSQAGCVSIFYGIESGSPKIQRSIKKNIKLETVIRNIKLTSKYGMGTTASLMMGFPDETEEDLVMTLKLRNKIKRLFASEQMIQLHPLAPDVCTEITQENIDRLAYDGFHSDHAGSGFTHYDVDMILKHRILFLSYYYIRMRHLDREFMKQLSMFMFATNFLAYWSSLYIMLQDRNPLTIFKKWRTYHESFEPPPGAPPGSTELMLATMSTTQFLCSYVNTSTSMPECIKELFGHELEKAIQKGLILTMPHIRERASRGEVLSTKKYAYDPELTIEALRKSLRAVKELKQSPVTMEYLQRGSSESGPLIIHRK